MNQFLTQNQFPVGRFRVALLLTFFPCAMLYPLAYPVREVFTLIAWVIAFPSLLSLSCLLLLPLFITVSYGYFAFNVFSVLTTCGVWVEASKMEKTEEGWQGMLSAARFCVVGTIMIAALQALDGSIWLSVFPDLQGLGDGRGAGLRTEPSLLAAPLSFYLSMLMVRSNAAVGRRRFNFLWEAICISVTLLVLTRSLSVAIAVLCFVPALAAGMRFALPLGIATLFAGLGVFSARLHEALSAANGSLLLLFTVAVGSWRSVPDVLILSDYKAYLLPGNPSQLREHLNSLAVAWFPGFEWLDNTYSTFSASASTLGIIVTGIVMTLGGVFGVRKMRTVSLRLTWILLYIACWFIFPKFEASGWLALAALQAVPDAATQTKPAPAPSFIKKILLAALRPAVKSSACS